MIFSFDLLINAIISGVLIGAFYAAVTAGITLSFGILDIVNIAHPAFIILGSYVAYIVNASLGLDPIVTAIVAAPAFYVLGAGIYQIYFVSFERRGQESMRGLAFFFGLLWGVGGLTFGLTMRYLGLSLGMAIVLGLCAAFGTLMPPLFAGEFASKVLGTTSGRTILSGVAVCMLGIAVAGMAGIAKERVMTPEQRRAVERLSSLVLCLGLPGDTRTALGRTLASCREAGQPAVLTLRQLRCHTEPLTTGTRPPPGCGSARTRSW